MNYNQWVSSSTYLFISARNPSVVSSSLRLIKCPVSLWNMKTGQQPSRTVWPCFLFYSVIYLMSLVVQFFLSFFFFCDLEQSTVQLFRELSNPPSDLSRAARPNRIVVLTLMTIPPAVAEPPVGHQEECVGGGAGRETEREVTDWQRETDTDGQRQGVSLCDALSLMWNNPGSSSEEEHWNFEVLYLWTTTSSILLFTPLLTKPHLFFFYL